MKKVAMLLLVVVCVCGAVYGQETGGNNNISKYVWIESEHVNPAKGQTYDKVVKQYRQVMDSGKSETHWLALNNITGSGDEVTFVTFANSLGDIDKTMKEFEGVEHQLVAKDAAFMADAATAAHGAMLDIARFQPQLSLRPEAVSMAEATRYRLTTFHVRPGCNTRFTDLVKDVIELDKKLEAPHWIAYVSLTGNSYTFVTGLRSLADMDQDESMAADKIFTASVRRDLDARVRECVAETDTIYQAVQPALSRVPATVMAANPSFWQTKEEEPVVAATKGKKSAVKPAAMKKEDKK